jgi:hypothetical protein
MCGWRNFCANAKKRIETGRECRLVTLWNTLLGVGKFGIFVQVSEVTDLGDEVMSLDTSRQEIEGCG